MSRVRGIHPPVPAGLEVWEDADLIELRCPHHGLVAGFAQGIDSHLPLLLAADRHYFELHTDHAPDP